jgi:hypothetical protein
MSEAGAQKAAIAATPISAVDIRAELLTLRKREGINLLKLRDHCPKLQSLPATMDHLEVRQMHPSNRHVAAYEVLECAISARVPSGTLVRILTVTLNIGKEQNEPKIDMEMNNQEDSNKTKKDETDTYLDARRKKLRAELLVGPKAFRNLEEEAYVQLSGALVAATRSPCSDEPSDPNFYTIIVDTPDRKFRLLWILIPLAATTDSVVRNKLATEMMALLPRARAALSGQVLGEDEPSFDVFEKMPGQQTSPWALARDLLDAVLMNAWPPPEDSTTSALTLLSAGSLAVLLLSDGGDVGVNHAQAAAREQSRFPDKSFVVEEERRASDDFLELKGDSLARLAEHIDRIERANIWAEILPGSLVHRKR